MSRPPSDTDASAARNLVEDTLEEAVQDISPEGVDRNQIRWMLSLTPAERLQVAQDFVDTFALDHEPGA